MRDLKLYDLLIIGSGCAGMTAAIYAGRARLSTLVVAGEAWGGQLMLTTEVENFPGFKDGILGAELMTRMREQAGRFGAEFLFRDATSVDFSSRPFRVTAAGKHYDSRAVIIATGASPKWLGVEGEKRFAGKGVSMCSTCDAPLYAGKKAVVVGGGDSAMEEALALAKFAAEVKVLHRRDSLRASKILQERAERDPKISFVWNSVVEEILGRERVEGIRIRRVDTGEESVLECDAVFLAIGRVPNTAIFAGQVELDERGYVVSREMVRTSVDGVFVAGEAADARYRQAIVEAGMGCMAAIEAQRYLETERAREPQIRRLP